MLARELGKTVGELLATISSAEFSEWEAFLRIENRGSQAANTTADVEQDLRKIFGRGYG